MILTGFAGEMGWKEAFPSERAGEVFAEFAALTAGIGCDYSGVSHARLTTEGATAVAGSRSPSPRAACATTGTR